MKRQLPWWRQKIFDAYVASGRTYAIRYDRNGLARVSLNGLREMNMHDALDKIDRHFAEDDLRLRNRERTAS